MKYDYLIVGQGLAGSIMAYQLIKRGKSIAIIDEGNPSSSSKVAAGLINPLTGPRMLHTWRAEQLFPYLKEFYREVEKKVNAKFFTDKTIYRPFRTIKEMNDWDGRDVLPKYQNSIKQICDAGTHANHINDEFGGVEVNGFVLDTSVFLEAMRNYFMEKCAFFTQRFDELALKVSDTSVIYNKLQADNIIICSGYQIGNSALFGWLPMAPVKGEMLVIKMEKQFETIYNRSCFIIPLGKGLYKAGSTYNRYDLTDTPTTEGKNEICQKLDALLNMKYEVVGHRAGVRPGTAPRRPLMGFHPEHPQVSVFNGLGTKGISLAPFFSNQFANCLIDGNNLDEEVDIKKYYSLYFNQHSQKN